MNALEFFFLCSQVAVAVVLLAVMESSHMRELHYKRLRNTFSAETITGSNEGKASEMPAARNGDNMDRQPVERHACAENTLSRRDTPSTGLNATNHARGSAAQEFEGVK